MTLRYQLVSLMVFITDFEAIKPLLTGHTRVANNSKMGVIKRKSISPVQSKVYVYDHESKKQALVNKLKEEQMTSSGRRLYANIYHPSFSTAKHFKKIANSLANRKQKDETFNITQGDINYNEIIGNL